MNYLGHLYVAGDDPELRLGGLLGDFVRGRDLSAFPDGVARGITLHRNIDAFTDRQADFRSACALVPAEYRRYSGILVDVYFGHLLARDWTRYHTMPLESYAGEIYALWQIEPRWLPERASRTFAAMAAGNWLASYATLEGTEAALKRLDRRLGGSANLAKALPELVSTTDSLESCFDRYLPQVVKTAETTNAGSASCRFPLPSFDL
jgi:acyl carrier protein phosphodiesterase